MPPRRPFRLLLLCSAVGALLLIGIAATLAWRLREGALTSATQTQRQLNIAVAEQTTRAIQSVDLVLAGIAEEIGAEAGDGGEAPPGWAGEDLHRRLAARVGSLPQIEGVGVIDRTGRLLNSSRIWPVPMLDLSTRDYFTEVRDREIRSAYVGTLVFSGVTQAPTLHLARCILGRNGRFLGVVAAALDFSYFREFYRDVVPGNGSTIILSRKGETLVEAHPRASTGGGLPADPASAAASPAAASRNGPKPTLASAVTLRDYPLSVEVSRSRTAILASWRGQVVIIGAMLAIALATFGMLVRVLARRFAAYELLAQAQEDAERAFRAQARAEAVSEAKSQFLATMSHELRTPLNAIIGFSEILKDQIFGPLALKYRDYAGDIYVAGQHLLGMVNDILELTKTEARQLEIKAERLDLAPLLARAASILRPQVEQGGLDLKVETAPDLPAVMGDERRLMQAFVNLVSNAVKFTPPAGTVTVAAHAVSGRVVVTVRDTGIGMAPQDIPRAMEPFVQVDSGMARKYQGTGLGLPLAKHLIELHGARFAIDSAVGSGTLVTIAFPPAPEGDGVPTPVSAVFDPSDTFR